MEWINVKDRSVRRHWLETMLDLAGPVLTNAAEGRLLERLPQEHLPGMEERIPFNGLEAFGRTLAGVAPWLNLDADAVDTGEADLLINMQETVRKGLAEVSDPESPDFIFGMKGDQQLVDTAFFAYGLLHGYDQLWVPLEPLVKTRIITAIKGARCIEPYEHNYLLFSALVETFLFAVGETCTWDRIEVAVQKFQLWYKGDGLYGDGADFHMDYYNSFVIQPMLIDILERLRNVCPKWNDLLPETYTRAQRYAEIQERLIAADGSFPTLGRSSCYRFGAFQLLAQMALKDRLPERLPPAQVRCALGAVICKVMEHPDVVDEDGWLRIGVYGHQPEMAEGYIQTGSLYLCLTVFLPLGLPPSAAFWSDPDQPFSAQCVWENAGVAVRDRYLGQNY